MAEQNRGTENRSTLVRTGVAPLDKQLGGGLMAGRVHLVTGGVATGKSTVCLQFLGAGLERGEQALLLTSARPRDLKSRATFAGVPIDRALRDGRLIALRYRPTFALRLAHSASPRTALDDLGRMLGTVTPVRIGIDPVTPFLSDGSPTGESLTALVDFLEQAGATAILTHPGDVAHGTDRRLDGLLERAATIIHLMRSSTGASTLTLLRGGSFAPAGGPAQFVFAPRSGISGAPARPGLDAIPATSRSPSRRLTVVHTTDALAPEILELLQRDYELTVAPLSSVVEAGGSADAAGAIVIETDHTALDATRAFVHRTSASVKGVAVIIIVRFNLRSIDHARLLRAGADEVLATDMSPSEVLQRLAAAVARGHLERPLIQYTERALTQASVSGGRPGLLDRTAFAGAVAAHVAHDHPTQYTVVSLAPGGTSRGNEDAETALWQLADVVMRTARTASGDLIGSFDGRLAVYLHGARLGDASPFVDRVRSAWPARERGSINIEFFSYPSDEPRLRTMMEASRQS